MHHVTTLDEHGAVITTEGFDDYGRASVRFCRIVLRHPHVHVQWVEGEELPGLPPKVIAQRFGDPCEKPCCVPLAEPWPEGTPTVTSS